MKKLTLFVAALCATTMAVNAASKTVILDGTTITATTSEDTQVLQDDITYVVSKGAKPTSVASTVKNAFVVGESAIDTAIFIGKKGTYIYNKTAFGKGITKFELYSNKGASTAVQVSVSFSTEPITAAATVAWEQTLSTADCVYTPDFTSGAKYFYFTVINDKNAQVAFRITYDEADAVAATAVALDKDAATVEQYKSFTLTATPTPADATDLFTWASDNTDVATVDATGKVTVLAAEGSANITVTSKTTATVNATCAVTAKEATILTCAEAVEKAKTVSGNNVPAADGQYVIRGYVTEIAYALKNGSMSVWMADEAGAANLFEAFTVSPKTTADETIKVGDFVEVVADITMYQKDEDTDPVYETVKGGTIRLIKASPATALENVEALEVYAENGRIYAAEGARIFTVSGIDVTEMNGQLNGIYIVKVGNQATKIAVK